MLPLMFSRRWWWSSLIVLVGIGLAIRLGIWQLDRNAQRNAAIAHIQEVQAMPVLDLNQRPLPSNLETMEFRQVTAMGEYDFDYQVALRNQVRPRMSGTDPGIALITPLILTDGQVVLVERGWIPLEYNTPNSWRQFDEPGKVSLQGIIRLSMAKGEMGSALIDPTLSPGQSLLDIWNFVNLTRLQDQFPYPILSVYIQQAPGSDLESLPYRLMEQPDLDPGAHIGFALQWFFYAGLLFFGYPIWLKKQKPK
jgi:surfeit locus 1 family protein